MPAIEKSQSAIAEEHPAFLFAMGELSGQVKALAGEITQMRLDRASERKELLLVINGHGDRIGTLEAWRWRTLGAAGAVTTVVQLIFTLWGK